MTSGLFDISRNRRTLMLAFVYATILAAAFYLSYEVRFDFTVPESFQIERLHLIWIAVGIKLLALILVRQLGSMMTYFSIPDLLRLIWAMTASSLALLAIRLAGPVGLGLPRGMLLVDFFLSLGGLCAVRLGTRMFRERLMPGGKRAERGPQQRIAIVGAGDAGASLAREFINSPSRGFKPVVFFDDDKDKHGKLIHGVPVVGSPEQIDRLKAMPHIAKVVIAMPTAPAKRIREVVLLMNQHGFKVETLPSMEELASGRVTASRIRPVEVQDLLGREAVDLDSAAIRRLIEGKAVMVTGAGGSIGSELCRQIAQLNPKRLLMVEQSEPNLFLIEQELKETGLGAVALPLIGDIADRDRMEFIFGRYRPAIVFHAAAHKHVYMMERQPAEAFRNNVLGTRLVAQTAARHGAEAVVLISTDKAINPTSVMGATKRLAELELQTAQTTAKSTKFMAVRFGNVLGSSGSVIPIFKRQIAHGGPVTVTHPEVTRYFMTIPEAVGLVLQSSVLGQGGEIFVLDMGQPVKIVDLARQMIELSGYRPGEDIEINFTGLKPGEKLFEELQHRNEEHAPTPHPKIMRFIARPGPTEFGADELRRLEQTIYRLESNEIKTALRRLVREYTPHLD
jgi:FlaA1/EpsC-like NDP-sugar epimerase